LALLFALIDTGRYMWGLNRLEKAAQMGARFAVVTKVVPDGLAAASYVGSTACGGTALNPGDTICAAALGNVKCTSASCTCETAPCPALGTFNATAFNNMLHRMQVFAPYLGTSNVSVNYSGSGLGFAGAYDSTTPSNPGMDIVPIVTVKLTGVEFRPIMLSFFNGTLPYPAIFRSLTLEDGQGVTAD
jgi:hypothetical protein